MCNGKELDYRTSASFSNDTEIFYSSDMSTTQGMNLLRLDAFQAIQAIQAVQAIQARIAQWIGKYWRNRIHVISF